MKAASESGCFLKLMGGGEVRRESLPDSASHREHQKVDLELPPREDGYKRRGLT